MQDLLIGFITGVSLSFLVALPLWRARSRRLRRTCLRENWNDFYLHLNGIKRPWSS
jgi:hypothetical protein